jgi:hypothetical protein
MRYGCDRNARLHGAYALEFKKGFTGGGSHRQNLLPSGLSGIWARRAGFHRIGA